MSAALALRTTPLDPHQPAANDADDPVAAWLAWDALLCRVETYRSLLDGRTHWTAEVWHRGALVYRHSLPEGLYSEVDARSLGEGRAHALGLRVER